MKLNSIYTKAAVCALAALSFTACNEIDEDDRYIETPIVEVSKHVLIEDFTGQRCINCPNASITIGQIQELYGADNVIAVAIHSGPFSKTLSGTPLSLWTEAGDHYYNTYASGASQPAGICIQPGNIEPVRSECFFPLRCDGRQKSCAGACGSAGRQTSDGEQNPSGHPANRI